MLGDPFLTATGKFVGGQGAKKVLQEVSEKIVSGVPTPVIAEEYPGVYIRYHKGLIALEAALLLKRIPSFRRVKTIVLWSTIPHVGKTRKAMEIANLLADERGVYKLDPSNNLWWDGYCGQKCIVLDDFYGWIRHGTMLNIMDGYPLRLEIKGGHTYAAFEYVFITSNKAHTEWYQKITDLRAFERRIYLNLFVDDVLYDDMESVHTWYGPKPADYVPGADARLQLDQFLTGELEARLTSMVDTIPNDSQDTINSGDFGWDSKMGDTYAQQKSNEPIVVD